MSPVVIFWEIATYSAANRFVLFGFIPDCDFGFSTSDFNGAALFLIMVTTFGKIVVRVPSEVLKEVQKYWQIDSFWVGFGSF